MRRELPNHLCGMPEWDRVRDIVAGFYKTYNVLGFGFLESVYREALAFELRNRGMRVASEVPLRVTYEGHDVGLFRADLLVDDRVVVETKATSVLGPTDKRQLLNYLRATTLDVGVLLHYGPEPKFYRIVSPRVIRLARHP
jgi:GxxExxY protein